MRGCPKGVIDNTFIPDREKINGSPVNNCNWGAITTIADWDGSVERIEYLIDQPFIDAVFGQSDGWSDMALILQGDMKGVLKMTILPYYSFIASSSCLEIQTGGCND